MLCKDVLGMLPSFVAGRTGGALREEITRHLAACKSCARAYTELSGREPEPPPPRERGGTIPLGTLVLLALTAFLLGLSLGMRWGTALRPLWPLWVAATLALAARPASRFFFVSPAEPTSGAGLVASLRLRASYLSPLQQALAIAARFPVGILLGSLLPPAAGGYSFVPGLLAAAALAKPLLDVLRPSSR